MQIFEHNFAEDKAKRSHQQNLPKRCAAYPMNTGSKEALIKSSTQIALCALDLISASLV